MKTTAPNADGKDLWEKFCKIERPREAWWAPWFMLFISQVRPRGPILKNDCGKVSLPAFCTRARKSYRHYARHCWRRYARFVNHRLTNNDRVFMINFANKNICVTFAIKDLIIYRYFENKSLLLSCNLKRLDLYFTKLIF